MSSDDYSPIEKLTITKALPLIDRLEVHTCVHVHSHLTYCVTGPKHFEL